MRRTFLGDFFQNQSRVMLICHMESHTPRCLSPASGVSTFQNVPPDSAGGKKTSQNKGMAAMAAFRSFLGIRRTFHLLRERRGQGDGAHSQLPQISGRGNVPPGEHG